MSDDYEGECCKCGTASGWIWTVVDQHWCPSCMAVELIRLQAIIAKLPKCNRLVGRKLVCDCPVVPGMVVWIASPCVREYDVFVIKGEGWVELSRGMGFTIRPADEIYDTREAAEAADED